MSRRISERPQALGLLALGALLWIAASTLAYHEDMDWECQRKGLEYDPWNGVCYELEGSRHASKP